MSNPTQYERYRLLIDYIDRYFNEPITADTIEAQCFYSYRNINRIFHALNHETIGQYIKRLRIEKAAEYLKYSEMSVAAVATAVGFSDTASFSKAFKKTLGTSPTNYRETTSIKQDMQLQTQRLRESQSFEPVEFELVELPDQHVLYSQYRGSYKNITAMTSLWEKHITYGAQQNLLRPTTSYLAEILDDGQITSSLNCRYNAAFSIDASSSIQSSDVFRRKVIIGGTYAKFVHRGSHATCADTYARIYSQWIRYVELELADKATIEKYDENSLSNSENEAITEIYIPVLNEKGVLK